jgi:dCMP deaminase
MQNQRKIKKIEVFTDFVSQISQLSVSQTLKVGAMAVKVDFSKIGSFGYNGSYTGAGTNPETGGEEESLTSGHSGFVHAEMNLVAKFHESDPENYMVLLTHSPCEICMKLIINSGFRYVFWKQEYRMTDHLSILDEVGIVNGDFEVLKNNYETILRDYREKKK